MKWIGLLLITSSIIYSCSTKKNDVKHIARYIDKNWLDSIIKKSDSTYTKAYGRTDFVTAVYYIDKKDSSITQLMKDSSENIRQVLVSKKNVRYFFAQYYPNGQLQAMLPLDADGQNNGHSIYYYDNGAVQSEGAYIHGLHTGSWKNYDSTGLIITTDLYDKNGAIIK